MTSGPAGLSTATSAPVVSVVIPVFNGERTLARTIASALAQTLREIEIVVVDDGSTDGTPRILRAIADPRVRTLRFDNAGLAASRNRGIRAARAPLVAFLDADDLWLPEKLADEISVFRDDPSLGLVYSWSECIDEDDRFLIAGRNVAARGRVYEQLLAGNFIANGSNGVIPRRVFEAVGDFDETLRAAEDWDMWLRIAWQFPVGCVPRVRVRYRLHAAAMSSNIERQEAECLKVLERGVERLPAGPERQRLRRLSLASLYRYLAGRSVRTVGGRPGGRLATRYFLRFVRYAPLDVSNALHVPVQLLRILLLLALPASWSARLLKLSARWQARLTGRQPAA